MYYIKCFQVLLLTMLISCTEEVTPKKSPFYFVAPEAIEYVLDFQRDVESVGLNIENENISFSVIMGRLKGSLAGIAVGMFNPYAVNVVLNIDIWRVLSAAERKALVYHELAHDVFELHHNTCDIMSGGVRPITEEMIKELLKTLKRHNGKG